MNTLILRGISRPRLALASAFAGLSLTLAGPASAGLTISPSTIANDYVGSLDLTVTGLDNAGQTVVIEEYYDADGSGTITGPDVLLRKFSVTDGLVTSIGGQRNLNVAGDEDGAANSQILTRLLYSSNEIAGKIDGCHLFRVSPSGAGFTPFTASLIVTQKDYAGSGVSGTILGGSPQVGQVGALVLLVAGGPDGDLRAITVAGLGGNYSLKAPAGSYQILAAKAGFVVNANTAPTATVTAGAFSSGQNVALTPGTRTISGRARDATSLAGVPGLPLLGQSQTGFIALVLADGNGDYVSAATADPWQFNLDGPSLARSGLLGFKITESSSVSVSGFNLDFPRATALIYGRLKTAANVAIPFTEVTSQTNGVPDYRSTAISNANGDYSLGTVPASWRVNSSPAGFLVSEESVVVNTNGSAVLQNLVAYPITAHLRGQIRDNHNNPVPNVVILAIDPNNMSGGAGIGAQANADASGNFDLGVFGGGGASTRAWQLQLNQNNSPGQFVSTSPVFQVQDGVDINGITYLVYVVTAHLRGQVLDENNSPIGNVNVFAGANNGTINTGTSADAAGNFDIALFGGTWTLGLSNINGLGLIPQDFSTVVTDGVDQNGLIFRARHSTTTITGTVRGANNAPIAGVIVAGSSTVSGAAFGSSTATDAGGNYSIPVFSATWGVSVNGADLASRGFQTVASQNAFVGGSSVVLNFVATPSTFSGWGSQYFTPAELGNSAISGGLADPDGDGINNVLEYAFHLNPRSADPSGLPKAGTLPISGGVGPYVTITYTRLIGATDLQYVVQESTTLTNGWSSASVTEDILTDDGVTQTVRAKVLQSGAKKFLRLNVTKAP